MKYYKMFINGNGIGMITSYNFKFINSQTEKTIIAPQEQAHCIQYQNNFYCTVSMPTKYMGNLFYQFVELVETTETEYNEYLEARDNKQQKQIIYPEPTTPTDSQQSSIQPQPQPESGQPKMTIQEMRDKITEQEQQIQLLTNYILELN